MIMFARKVDGKIISFPYELESLRSDFRNVSFPEKITLEIAVRYGVVPVNVSVVDVDPLTHDISYSDPVEETRTITQEELADPETGEFDEKYRDLVGTQVHTGRYISELIPVEKPLEQAQANIRNKRDTLLQETDWVVVMHTEKGTNIPMEWEVYRQALRDITAQVGFPYSVEWPTKP